MIELYTANTPNGHRVELMLEEIGLLYSNQVLSLAKGEHRTDNFRKLNPAARIPIFIDHNPTDDEPFILTQTTAILLYLAEKAGRLLAGSARDRARVLEWLSVDATDMAPTRFDAFWLALNEHDEAAQLLRERALEYYRLYDRQLASHEYLGGDEYSVADVAAYPWARAMAHPNAVELPNLCRWKQQLSQRPACRKVFQLEGSA